MKRSRSVESLALLSLLAVLAGCMGQNAERASGDQRRDAGGGDPAPVQSSGSRTAPSATENPEAVSGGMASAHGLAWDVPRDFAKDTPASTMRAAQYRLPSGKEGVGDGELAVFFFGSGQGGATQANLTRWAGQFQQEDGSDPMSKAKIEDFTAGSGLKVTTISVAGRYESSGMGGGPSYNEPGWALLGAVVEGPGGPWFFKAVGPGEVIDRHRDDLMGVLRSVRPAAS